MTSLSPATEEPIVAELAGGWRLVGPLDDEALRRERALVGHGLGEFAYDGRHHKNHCRFLSLRDAVNHPHATLAVAEDRVVRLQVRPGGTSAPACAALLHEVFQAQGWQFAVPACLLGYAIDTDGHWHSLDALPDGLSIPGDLDLRETSIRHLPSRLQVGSGLHLDHAPITRLPQELAIGGNLRLILNPLKQLPEGLFIPGSLMVRQTPLESLPASLRIGGNLNLSGVPITSLPEDLQLGGNLRIERSALTFLPAGLHIRGHLSLLFSKLKALPSGLVVEGNLNISFCDFLKRLPEGLAVGGDLDIVGTPIASFPEGLTVGGSLKLSRGAVPELPASLGDETIIVSDFGTLSAAEYRSKQAKSKPEEAPPMPGRSM